MEQRYVISEVARLVGVPSYRIDYCLAQGRVPQPGRWNRLRVFTDEDVGRIREYFRLQARSKISRPQSFASPQELASGQGG